MRARLNNKEGVREAKIERRRDREIVKVMPRETERERESVRKR